MKISHIILGIAAYAALMAGIAYAGTSSVPITPGAGVNMAVVTTATGSDVAEHVICDYSAAANCAAVDTSHELLTTASISGTATVAGNVGAALGTTATSGPYTNLLQGNAVLSAANPLFTSSVISVSGGFVNTLVETGSTVAVSNNVNVTCTSGCSGSTGTNITQWASTSLASATNYGTAPSGIVGSVNAYVTSGVISIPYILSVVVSNTNANGQATMANSSPVVIASNQSSLSVTQSNPSTSQFTVNLTQVLSSAISVTNPVFTEESGGSGYGNKNNFLSGSTSSSTSNTAVQIIAAPASNKIYVTGVQCWRLDAGTSATYVTLNDSANSVVALVNNGGGGGNNFPIATPLTVAATTSLSYKSNAPVALGCNAQGYNAP